jgi:cyclophilin family peptidyl-prolyl cis-trans isomerase
VPGFVVQGGGFSITPEGNVLDVPTYGPVQNEFGASNLRGTVAMAKVGGDPNSATSGWFFNLADNSANLDYQNGGFTVFGDVDSMAAVDAIAALVTVNAGDPFDNLPLRKFDGANIFLADLIYLDGATRQPDALTFSVSGSVPGASATISGGRLVIASTGTGVTATGALTLRATAPDGRFLDVPIAVTVDTNRAPVLDKGIAARTITCTEDKPAKIKFSAKDADKGDILTWSIPTPPTLGVLAPVLGKPGSYVYTPNRDVNGTDAFTVRVTDSQGASSTLPVTIIIKPVNDAPTAAGLDGISIPGGQASVVDFTVADVDSPIEAVQVIVPAKAGKLLPVGSIVLGGAGANRTLTLTPLAPAVTTVVKLKITLTDGQAKAKRTLYVTVDPPPPPPPPPPAPAG